MAGSKELRAKFLIFSFKRKKQDKAASYSLAGNPNLRPHHPPKPPTQTHPPTSSLHPLSALGWGLGGLWTDDSDSKFGFAVYSYLLWRRVTAKCKASLISACQGLFASLPACLSDVCVGAAGRKDNRVIVALENYDCSLRPSATEVWPSVINSLTVGPGRRLLFFFTLHLAAFTGKKRVSRSWRIPRLFIRQFKCFTRQEKYEILRHEWDDMQKREEDRK